MTEPEKRFTSIGYLFAINGYGWWEGGRLYVGGVLVSAESIYLTSTAPPLGLKNLFLRRLNNPAYIDKTAFPLTMDELETEVTAHEDWPIRTVRRDGDDVVSRTRVRVLNRSAGFSVSSTWFNKGVTICCGNDWVWLKESLMFRRKMRQILSAYGW